MALNGIRAVPLMAYNGKRSLRLLNGKSAFLFNVILCHSASETSDCHSLSFNAILGAHLTNYNGTRTAAEAESRPKGGCCNRRLSGLMGDGAKIHFQTQSHSKHEYLRQQTTTDRRQVCRGATSWANHLYTKKRKSGWLLLFLGDIDLGNDAQNRSPPLATDTRKGCNRFFNKTHHWFIGQNST